MFLVNEPIAVISFDVNFSAAITLEVSSSGFFLLLFDDAKKAIDFGAADMLIVSKKYDKDKYNILKTVCEQMGTSIEIVSTETTEGEQFWKLGGIGVIQRFAF